MADDVKVSKFGSIKRNFLRFFREVRSELRKVIWPNREQLTHNTITVLLACLLVGIIIWLIDAGLLYLTQIVFIR